MSCRPERAYLSAARNQTLCNIHRALAGRVRHARYLANLSQARWAKAVEEHEQILAALAARDGARLSGILTQYLTNKLEVVRESLLGGQWRKVALRANPAKVEDFGDKDLLQHTDLARILFGEVIPLRREAR